MVERTENHASLNLPSFRLYTPWKLRIQIYDLASKAINSSTFVISFHGAVHRQQSPLMVGPQLSLSPYTDWNRVPPPLNQSIQTPTDNQAAERKWSGLIFSCILLIPLSEAQVVFTGAFIQRKSREDEQDIGNCLARISPAVAQF